MCAVIFGKSCGQLRNRLNTKRNVGVIGIASSFPELLQIAYSVDHDQLIAVVATLTCVAGG